jgi:hypothetical protein
MPLLVIICLLFFLYLIGRHPGILLTMGKGFFYLFIVPLLVIGAIFCFVALCDAMDWNILGAALIGFMGWGLLSVICKTVIDEHGYSKYKKYQASTEKFIPNLDKNRESAKPPTPLIGDGRIKISIRDNLNH